MTGASPIVPSVADAAILLGASQRTGGPLCATLELCILTLALPFEVTQINLDRIDWENGCTQVATRRGQHLVKQTLRTLALPPAALDAVRRIAGSAKGSGQVVTAGRGEPLAAKYVRLDRLCEQLARGAPETIPIMWNFHGLRQCAATIIAHNGHGGHGGHGGLIDRILGRDDRSGFRLGAAQEAAMASKGLEVWHRALHRAAASAHVDRS